MGGELSVFLKQFLLLRAEGADVNLLSLHRKHRGLMQWGAARKVASLGKGMESTAGSVKSKVRGVFEHSTPQVGVEKEV